MTVYHTLPSVLGYRAEGGLGITPMRECIVTPRANGPQESTTYWDAERARYEVELCPFPSTDTTRMPAWMRFLEQIQYRRYPFYLLETFSRAHREMFSAHADGTLTTFPVPVLTPSSLDLESVNGVYATIGTTLYAAANLLTDDQASVETDDYSTVLEVVGTAALTRKATVSCDGLSCARIAPTGGAQANVGVAVTSASAPAATAGVKYTGMASFLPTAASATGIVRLTFLNAQREVIGSPSDSASTTIAATEWTQVTVTATAPATTAYVKVSAIRTTSSAAVLWVDCLGIAPGDYTHWHLPSVSPGLMVYASAPAANAVIRVHVTGRRLAKVRMTEASQSWKWEKPGRAIVNKFTATEEW